MSYTLLEGDCLERMQEIPDGSIDIVLTDPPYGTTACKWDTVIPLVPMWEQLKRIIKPNKAIALMARQPFTSALIVSNLKMFKYCWVWNKKQGGNPLNAKRQPLRTTEDVIIFNEKGAYCPQMRTGRHRKKGGNPNQIESVGKITPNYSTYNDQYFPTCIIEIVANRNGSIHPTQKPVALMEYLIKTYTNEGEVVLDFTMGSGTTGVAAKNLRRDFIGIELDHNYFEIAEQRIKETVIQPSLFEAVTRGVN